MAKRESLRQHPRLFAGPQELGRLRRRARAALLRAWTRQVACQAERYASSPHCAPLTNTHNAHLLRARELQHRVVTLLVRWFQTGDERLRDAVVGHVREMAGWQYWSWIAWRMGDPRPDAVFDLSCGENSATLAIAFDWLHDTLSADERALFVTTARERALQPFLAQTKATGAASWFCARHSNWNAVCAGGAGLLALAMYDELPEARRALPRVEKSVGVFMRGLAETGGGWTEGIGYWNYGMSYAFIYLLSHERATGRKHPLLALPETKITLGFPIDFCPNGVPCSFGDSNGWSPMSVHYAAARRLGRADVAGVLEDRLIRGAAADGGKWPGAEDWLVVHPGRRTPAARAQHNVARLYDGLDWGVIADRMPGPRLYMSVRGGTTKVHHGHRDLLSYHCVVGDEAMVTNLGIEEYLDSTFSPRRAELFEVTPASKNVILINGVGIAEGSSVTTRPVRGAGLVGMRMDATEAMGVSRDGPAADFCGRLFLMLEGKAFLIVDRVVMAHDGRVESRAHTRARVKAQAAGAMLTGERQHMRLAYACNVPATLHTAVTAPTRPGEEATVLRWCADELHTDIIMATLLWPGEGTPRVTISPAGRGFEVAVSAKGLSRRLTLTSHLGLARRRGA
jgi:hypothetical protein